MTGQELKIIFESDKAYLTKDKPLTFEQISLPKTLKLFNEPAYLLVKVLSYSETEKKIFCEILSYNIGKTEFDFNQKNLFQALEVIQKVTFPDIKTMPLLAMAKGTVGTSFSGVRNSYINEPQQIKQIIIEKFKIPFKEILFKNCGVVFEFVFKKHNQKVVFTISNLYIREEFDAIKDYFSNVLKTKKIQVEAELEIAKGQLTPISVKSHEVDKINNQLIEEVRLELIRQTIKKKSDTTKSIFTLDEYFDTFTNDKLKSKVFYKNDTEFFEDLITISNTKHYKHLRYLSSIHSHETMRLRFIHKPLSFLFLIKGINYYHYIWETLDTIEATYIWHIEKNTQTLKDMLTNIDKIITEMNTLGKTQYLNKKEDSFKRVIHDYTKPDDGFEKWKEELNKILT